MKAARYVIPIVLIIALSLSSGCLGKKYYFNFTTENDFARDDGTWSTYDNNYSLSSDGLKANGCWVAAPHFYSGDFTVTWEFLLDVAGGQVEDMEFFLSSQAGWDSADWYGGIAFWEMGTPSSSLVTYYRAGGSLIFPQPGLSYEGILNEAGLNEVQLIKVGNWLNFKINGISIDGGFEIVGYDADLFCPNIWCLQDMVDDTLLIKSVEVKYSGDQTLRF